MKFQRHLLKNTGFKRLAKFRTASLQIKEATTPNGTSKYFYDGAGRRVAKEVNGTRSDYLLMGSEVLKTYENGAPKAEYFLGLGRHGIKTNNSWKYYLTDGLGSTVSLTDDTGSTVAAYDYDDYGETSQIAGSNSVYNPFLYTGQEWDAELGMYNLHARHYSPTASRFIARDPIGHAGGSNLYAYCNGDPIGHSDPSGLSPIKLFSSVGIPIRDSKTGTVTSGLKVVVEGTYDPATGRVDFSIFQKNYAPETAFVNISIGFSTSIPPDTGVFTTKHGVGAAPGVLYSSSDVVTTSRILNPPNSCSTGGQYRSGGEVRLLPISNGTVTVRIGVTYDIFTRTPDASIFTFGSIDAQRTFTVKNGGADGPLGDLFQSLGK